MNNIHNKLAELQWQIQHRDPHMNSGDTIQIEAPDFNPDIDDISPTAVDQELSNRSTQGTTSLTPKSTEPEIEYICHAHQDGGSSQGSTKHSLPPARRRGGFNMNDQLNSSTER